MSAAKIEEMESDALFFRSEGYALMALDGIIVEEGVSGLGRPVRHIGCRTHKALVASARRVKPLSALA